MSARGDRTRYDHGARMTTTTTTNADIEALLTAGKHAEAARQLEQMGELPRAQALRESIWDFQGAADVARLRGDVVDELRLRLEAGETARASELVPLLPQLDVTAQERAEIVLEKRQLYLEAAELADQRGALQRAERLYMLAQRTLEAARVAERRGDLKRAGGLYEALLADPTTGRHDRAEAQSELARLLAALGRHYDALALLQPPEDATAARLEERVTPGEPAAEADRVQLDRQRVHYFYRLGLMTAARTLLARITPGGTVTDDAVHDLVEVEQGRERRQQPELVAGRYRVLSYLGAGAVGRVYLAHDEVGDRRCALKLVPPPVDDRLRAGYEQFLQEVKVLYQVHHPGLVALYDVDEQNGLLCTEYLDGGSLAERALPLEPATVRQILDEVLATLAVVHAHGVVHRDIKPANLLVAPSGRIKVADFGASHLRSHGVTQTAGFVGTLGFMSPEQIRGQAPTFAVDLYGVGCTLYQLLTGRLPFPGPDFAAQHLADPPPRPSRSDPSLVAWDEIVVRALQKRPSDRYPSAAAMREAILRIPLDRTLKAGVALEPSVLAPRAADGGGGAQQPRLLEPLGEGPHTVWRAIDERIGRALEIEPLPTDESAREARRRWLIPLAQCGPAVQRIFGLDADRVRFEALDGARVTTLDGKTRAAIGAALEPLWQSGQTHGGIESSLVQTPSGIVLRLAGVAPSTRSVADERAALAAIPADRDADSRTAP